jgi:hypothetical protein
MKKKAKLELRAKEIDEDKRYGLFLRAFHIGLRKLGIDDVYFAPVKVSKDSYNVIKRKNDKLVFTMVRETK